MKKGKYIVFEGIDGAGKSTLISKLKHYLHTIDQPAVQTFEPTNSPIGSMIRNILTGRLNMTEQTIAALFVADRLDHLQNNVNGIMQYIDKGTHVLGDRYYLSSYAYHVPHVSLDWVIQANSICAAIKRPDITIFVDIDVDTSLHRITQGRDSLDMYENRERINQVYHNYRSAINRVKDQENIIIIDGNRPLEEVYLDLIGHINPLL